MSLLINEAYANPEVSLWLDKDIASSVVTTLVPNSASQGVSVPFQPVVVASVTFPTPINYAKLNGWIRINATGSGLTGCSLYLVSGLDTAWLSSKGTQLTGLTLGAGANYFILDSLVRFDPNPFTTLSLILLAGASPSSSVSCGNGSGSIAYTSLPTTAGWTNLSDVASIMCVGGLV